MEWKRESPDRLVKLQIESPNLNYITVTSPQPTHINICVAKLFWVIVRAHIHHDRIKKIKHNTQTRLIPYILVRRHN